MNERIKKLAEQAGAVFTDSHAASLLDGEIEKFAELVAKEIMQVVANNLPPNTYLDVAEAVLEHFTELKNDC